MDVRNTVADQGHRAGDPGQPGRRPASSSSCIPGDNKQTLTKYRARQHDIYIGQWGPDYQDPHTNAETFAVQPRQPDDARRRPLAWRNAWDIPEMTKETQAAVLERDAAKRAAIYEEIQREHQKISPFVIIFQQIESSPRASNRARA